MLIKVSNEDYRIKRNNEIIFVRLAGFVSMKHNYVKIMASDFTLLKLYLKVDKLPNIFINDCQKYDN